MDFAVYHSHLVNSGFCHIIHYIYAGPSALMNKTCGQIPSARQLKLFFFHPPSDSTSTLFPPLTTHALYPITTTKQLTSIIHCTMALLVIPFHLSTQCTSHPPTHRTSSILTVSISSTTFFTNYLSWLTTNTAPLYAFSSSHQMLNCLTINVYKTFARATRTF